MRCILVLALAISCRGEPAAKPHGSAAAAPPAAPVQRIDPPGAPELVAVPADVAGSVALREIARDLKQPVLVTFAPGDARRRLFVVEQRGAIRVIEHGQVSAQPFFTIDGLATGEEQGLLGLAFHPDFAHDGRLYVDYTTKDRRTHVVEYRAAGDAVDPTTARELIAIAHPYSNHNGGNLLFGPDRKLYSGMGDGGAANDPYRNGQNPRALLARLLRYDVDARDPGPEIVDIGLRNPWRFWFDKPTGDLYIGDVGQNLWEEIDVVAGGDHERKNFGWNILEGTHCFDADNGTTKDECDRSRLTPPAIEYPHTEGCSITGGVTYRGKTLPVLDGVYFYADYCTALLRSFRWSGGRVRDHWDWKAAIDPDAELQNISSFGTDADGEIYIVTLGGKIFELVPRG